MNTMPFNEFIKENLWKIVVVLVGLIVAWTQLQGSSTMSLARIEIVEARVDQLEDALTRIVVLEERNADNREDIQEIKGVVKEINQKLDDHIIFTNGGD